MNIPKLLPLLAIVAAAVPAADAQIAVSSATPSMAEQDTISLDVTISGAGFSRGSTAQWFVTGTANPGGVIVNSTRYVNSSKLVANVTVSAGANLSTYDIMVSDRNGRSGKGIELFKVVEKVVGCVLPQNTGFQQIATLNTGAFGPEFGAAVAAKEIRGSGTPVLVAATFGGRAEVYTLDNINTSADPWQVSLSHRMTVDFGGSIRWMDMGYVNGDVYPDIGVASQGSQKAWVALSRPTADGFAYDVVELVPPAGFANYGRFIAFGDIDGVPGDEVVVSSIGGKSGGRTLPGKVATFFFNGTGLDWKQTIADPVTAGGTGFGTSVALGRLTSDAYADLVVGSPSNSVVYVYNKTQSSANEQAYGASSPYATDRQENLG